MKISKELLSEVLGEDVRLGIYTTVESDEDELVQHIMKIEIYGNRVSYWRYYTEWDNGNTMVRCQINSNELTFKIEDWIESKDINVIRIKENKLYKFYINSYIDEETNELFFENLITSETKIKGIIAVGEFILKEINEKQLQH